MKEVKKIYAIITKKNKILYLCSIVMTIVSVILTLFITYFIRFFIDIVISDATINNKSDVFMSLIARLFDINYLKQNIFASAKIIVLVSFINAIILFFKEMTCSKATESIIKQLKDNIFSHIQKLTFDYLKKAQTGDLLQRSTSDVDVIRKFLQTQFLELTKIIIFSIISIYVMFSVNVKLSIYAVMTLPIIFIISFVFFLMIKKIFLKIDEKEGELTTVLQENLSGIRVVRAFGREKFEFDKYTIKNNEYAELVKKMITMQAMFWSISEVICQTQIIIVIFISSYMSYTGEISIGTTILFVTYETMLIFPIRQLGRILSDFGKMEVSIKRIYEIQEQEEESEIESESESEGAITPNLIGDICFKNVSFKFSDSDSDMLKDISFTAKEGETIAVLGGTGSGKSTLMYLLLRLYDYDFGNITINNIELKNIKKNYLRKKIGIVLQDPFLYSKTIKENIKLAKFDASDDEIFKVSKASKIHDVIDNFEDGYETIVGEKGVTLSGGQKQRLTIARTLIKQSDILIFDDSLSAVDSETDAQIRKQLKNFKAKITFIISQRISTIKEADKIIVLEKGEITAIGSHEELIIKDGLYKNIWDIQNRRC